MSTKENGVFAATSYCAGSLTGGSFSPNSFQLSDWRSGNYDLSFSKPSNSFAKNYYNHSTQVSVTANFSVPSNASAGDHFVFYIASEDAQTTGQEISIDSFSNVAITNKSDGVIIGRAQGYKQSNAVQPVKIDITWNENVENYSKISTSLKFNIIPNFKVDQDHFSSQTQYYLQDCAGNKSGNFTLGSVNSFSLYDGIAITVNATQSENPNGRYQFIGHFKENKYCNTECRAGQQITMDLSWVEHDGVKWNANSLPSIWLFNLNSAGDPINIERLDCVQAANLTSSNKCVVNVSDYNYSIKFKLTRSQQYFKMQSAYFVPNGEVGYLTRDNGKVHFLLKYKVVGTGTLEDDWQIDWNPVTSEVISEIIDKKYPQIQIKGADSWANDGFIGANYTASDKNKQRGSWSQYGLFANEKITNFGSAGWNLFENNLLKSCKLWFANKGACVKNSLLSGNFMANSREISLPRIISSQKFEDKALYLNTLNLSSTTLNSLKSDRIYRFSPSGSGKNKTMKLSGNGANIVLPLGKKLFLYVDGNITIQNNILFATENSGKYTRLQQIPQLIIYATGNINIAPNVEKISGIFIAGGKKIFTKDANFQAEKVGFRTCTKGDGALFDETSATVAAFAKNGDCARQLVINGAVISSGDVVFHRTFGGENDSPATPSEIIQYSPNLYLSPNSAKPQSGLIEWKTVKMQILPARW